MKFYKVTFTRGGFYEEQPVAPGFTVTEALPAEGWTAKDFEHYYQTRGVVGEVLPTSDWEDLFQ